jgi:hypothetical protein
MMNDAAEPNGRGDLRCSIAPKIRPGLRPGPTASNWFTGAADPQGTEPAEPPSPRTPDLVTRSRPS